MHTQAATGDQVKDYMRDNDSDILYDIKVIPKEQFYDDVDAYDCYDLPCPHLPPRLFFTGEAVTVVRAAMCNLL